MKIHQEDSGEMYSPNEQGQYMPEVGLQNFSVQGLTDVLATLDPQVTEVQLPVQQYALMLEVTMED